MRAHATLSRWIAVAALVILVVGVVATVGGGDGDRHDLYVTVKQASNLLPGQAIRVAGQDVGRVGDMDPVDGGHAVRLRFEIDGEAWPLPQGSRFTLRWGGTISYNNRHVVLQRGKVGAPPIADGARLPPSAFVAAPEFDDLIANFGPALRTDLKALLDDGGQTLLAARPALRRVLRSAPAALEQAQAVTQQLADGDKALATIVRAGDRVVDAVHSADPGIADLIDGAQQTLGATAAESRALSQTLTDAQPTVVQLRQTLSAADPTLRIVRRLTERIAPGATELRRTIAPLTSVVRRVRTVAPDASATLATARDRGPAINRLLTTATPILPTIADVADQARVALHCVRPYAPDIAGFLSTWGDFISAHDGKDKYFRAQIQNLIPAPYNAVNENSASLTKKYPDLRFAFPMPPGFAAGQPWLIPECGVGPEALDPNKDPENRPPTAQELFTLDPKPKP